MSQSTVAPDAPAVRNRRRLVIGQVVRDSRDKTAKVVVQQEFKHPKYEKRMRRRSIYMAHDEKNEAKAGDVVELRETRRLSKTKFWCLARVLKRAGER
jgi:small subunit ribosomal protein S17